MVTENLFCVEIHFDKKIHAITDHIGHIKIHTRADVRVR